MIAVRIGGRTLLHGLRHRKTSRKHSITQDALDHVGQQDAKRRAHHSKSRNQPEICAECYGAGDRRIQKVQVRALHHDYGLTQRHKRVRGTSDSDDPEPGAALLNAGP